MKKTFLISVLVCVIVTACGGQESHPAAFPSTNPGTSSPANSTTPSISIKIQSTTSPTTKTFTPLPAFTATSPIISTPTKKPPNPPPPTPTVTPFPPYQNKNVIFDYYEIGQHSGSDSFFDPHPVITKLVLYDDGQLLIAGPGDTFKQKVLSSDEIKSFLSRLESLGFYTLESNQKRDPTDKLYDYGDNYQKTYDGLWECILVDYDKARTLCVYQSDIQYLIPAMKNILNYLDAYNPAGTTPYVADRILLEIQKIDEYFSDLPPAVPWNDNFPSLEYDPSRFTSDTSNQVIYIEGPLAKEIYLFFEGSDGSKVVTQNGKDYIVYLRVILPHEKVLNHQR